MLVALPAPCKHPFVGADVSASTLLVTAQHSTTGNRKAHTPDGVFLLLHGCCQRVANFHEKSLFGKPTWRP